MRDKIVKNIRKIKWLYKSLWEVPLEVIINIPDEIFNTLEIKWFVRSEDFLVFNQWELVIELQRDNAFEDLVKEMKKIHPGEKWSFKN